MNSPTNEPAVTLNETPHRIAGLSDVFILWNFASIRSSEGLRTQYTLKKIKICDFANKLDDLSECSSYRLTFSRCCWNFDYCIHCSLVGLHVPKQVKPLKSWMLSGPVSNRNSLPVCVGRWCLRQTGPQCLEFVLPPSCCRGFSRILSLQQIQEFWGLTMSIMKALYLPWNKLWLVSILKMSRKTWLKSDTRVWERNSISRSQNETESCLWVEMKLIQIKFLFMLV